MFEVLAYQPRRNPASRPISAGSSAQQPGSSRTNLRRISSAYSIWPPYRKRYYVNLCTVKHENTSCTSRNPKTRLLESLPVMACRTSWWSGKDTSIGRVIGFKPKENVRSGVTIELLHGDRCYSGKYAALPCCVHGFIRTCSWSTVACWPVSPVPRGVFFDSI